MTWAQNQFRNKLKRYYTDFGREFDNELFKTWCEKNRVRWKPSALYSPEQNSKTKRLKYTLISLVRFILSTIKLPKSLWFEILKIIAYLKNCSPSINGITAFEYLKKEKPNRTIIKLLALILRYIFLRKNKQKLDKRSWQGIFVRYENKN